MSMNIIDEKEPKRKPNRKRSKQIAVRVTEAQYNEIMLRVATSGMTQQEFYIKAILNKQVVNTDGLKAVVPEILRVGNNLNQLAKKANEGKVVASDELLEMKKEFDETWQLLRRVIAEQA